MAERWIAPRSKTAGSLVGFHFNCHQRTARRENLEARAERGTARRCFPFSGSEVIDSLEPARRWVLTGQLGSRARAQSR
jgi:hypothetical protein